MHNFLARGPFARHPFRKCTAKVKTLFGGFMTLKVAVPYYPVISRIIPIHPGSSRHATTFWAQKKHQKILLMLIRLQLCSILFRIAITEMLFAIAITSWHTQSHQLVIHVC